MSQLDGGMFRRSPQSIPASVITIWPDGIPVLKPRLPDRACTGRYPQQCDQQMSDGLVVPSSNPVRHSIVVRKPKPVGVRQNMRDKYPGFLIQRQWLWWRYRCAPFTCVSSHKSIFNLDIRNCSGQSIISSCQRMLISL